MSQESAITLKRDCDSIEIPSGALKRLPAGTTVRVLQSRGGSFTVATNYAAMYRIDSKDADALGLESSATKGPEPAGSLTEQMVVDQLKTVFDPEIPVNIVDLGLVYGCNIIPIDGSAKKIDVKMTMTAPGCGMSNVLKTDVENKLRTLPQVKEVNVEVVFEPAWNPSRMSDAARLQLGLDLDEGSSPFSVLR